MITLFLQPFMFYWLHYKKPIHIFWIQYGAIFDDECASLINRVESKDANSYSFVSKSQATSYRMP